MAEHPIEGMMGVTMEKIRQLVDANTIIGEPITVDGATIIPISRVTFGFASGGSDVGAKTNKQMFGGGTGAGVTVQPLGFLVTGPDSVRLLPAQPYAPVDRIIELVPQTLCEIKNALSSCMERKKAAAQESPAAPQE